MATTTTPVTAPEYTKEERELHALYLDGSPSYVEAVGQFGKQLRPTMAQHIAAQHSTTVEELEAEGGLTASPRTGLYGMAHLFAALGY